MSDCNKNQGTKRKALSLIDKLEIIRLCEKDKRVDVAKAYGVSESAISVIMTNKEKIEKDCSERNNLNTKRRRVGKYEDVENCFHDWLLEMRRNNVPLNGPILCEKAISFNQMLNQNNDFSPNSGWLQHW
jgi:hypothetical protein